MDLLFNPSIDELCTKDNLEIFLAPPHGTAASYAIELLKAKKKVIDLSADFRPNSAETYHEFYGEEHPAKELLLEAQYGLPELHELNWEKSKLIASPGCYPTSILIPLAPTLESGLVEESGIVVNSMSGISGAGRNLSEKLLYCERMKMPQLTVYPSIGIYPKSKSNFSLFQWANRFVFSSSPQPDESWNMHNHFRTGM